MQIYSSAASYLGRQMKLIPRESTAKTPFGGCGRIAQLTSDTSADLFLCNKTRCLFKVCCTLVSHHTSRFIPGIWSWGGVFRSHIRAINWVVMWWWCTAVAVQARKRRRST